MLFNISFYKRMKLRHILLFVLILLIGTYLRFYNLGYWGFWHDEVGSMFVAKFLNWHILSKAITYTICPPLLPILLHFWRYLGSSEFILRLLPLVFSILSIIVTYKIGQLLFNTKTGLISAFLLSISPFHIYYSQELRAYSLLAFVSLMSIFYLIKCLKRNKLFYWVGLIIFTALSLYTHNIAIFLLIAENIFFILFYKRYKTLLQKWLIAQLFIVLFYLPYFKNIFEQTVYFQISDIFQPPPLNHLFNFIQSFIIFNSGYNSPETIQCLTVLLFTPLFFLGVLYDNKKEETGLLLCWLLIPIALTLILAIFIRNVYLPRTLIHVSVAYYILTAYGISKLKPKNLYLYILLFYTILTGFGLNNYYQNIFPSSTFLYCTGVFPRKETKLAASYIENNFQEGDIIGHTNMFTYAPFYYYHNGRLEDKLFTLGYLKNFHFVFIEADQFIKMLPVDIREITRNKYNRIWLVFSSYTNNQIDQLSKDIKDYFDRNYIMVDCKEFVGITIYLYQIK